MCPLPTEKKAVQSEGLHSVALERNYSVPEVAALWGISEKRCDVYSTERMEPSGGEAVRLLENVGTKIWAFLKAF
jgi:predicted transcriptional regulator